MADGWAPPESLAEYATLDHDRSARRGFAEAVLCESKTVDQVAGIARDIAGRGTRTLFTRVPPEQVDALLGELPGAAHDRDARVVAWPGEPPPPTGGLVVVVAAGTSDLPVAREAAVTARHLGRPCRTVVDVGVAGLHRVLGQLDLLRSARAIVVVAGMDGALPGVVAGLVPAPVVAVPTSVGYGASFGGIAALLTMLNACAPGVAVVNIDNGYGAGHLAAQIAAPVGADGGPAGGTAGRTAGS
ncbi:nickel pincer cofactor biosynthesis protein LarB [uncultured Cellulomonas sp.]|uniref:nickel pincer cofactor biosynthesis protein LarB n=1 Tax=uncultured Cellulomonas sp. TaxID=189682 RepID=UPI0026085162|nr:nickel pincer cofactor biosynthesis protein LarB [uncultured Cellulomonas sp.]